MYYNIKITSNGSEFSLNSNDREITQNEMDKYFAQILGVSEEFKAKLKHVIVNNKNVKSIEMLNETKEANKNITLETLEQKIEPQQNLITSREQQTKNDIDELLSLAQKKFDNLNTPKETKAIEEEKPSFEINSDKVDINISVDEKMPEQPIAKEEAEEEKTQDLLDSIFKFNPDSLEEDCACEDNVQEQIEEVKNESSLEIQTPNEENQIQNETEEQVIPQEIPLEEDVEINIKDVELTIEEAIKEEITPTLTEEKQKLPPEIEQYIATDIVVPEFSQLTETKEEVAEIKEEIETKEQEETLQTEIIENKEEKKEIQLCADFKEFLSHFTCQDIYDEFLICAYHIKNALEQESFTMKFINSKLFQTSGKIANLSIVDELIAREYIKVIETDDSKKYTITQSGEEYFANRFQG